MYDYCVESKLYNYYKFKIDNGHYITCNFFYLGSEPDADLGPLISPEAKNRVCELVQSGINEGAQILLDGRDIKVKGYEKGNFVGPTVLHYVKVIKE
jgi:acyl-CoA reductase-like NAD-dependent aldehyde dehydrogenase